MINRHHRLLLVAIVVTGAYLLGTAFDWSPWLRGPQAWRWPYVIPGTVSRLWLSVVVLSGYVGMIWWVEKRPLPHHRLGFILLLAGVMTPLIQLSLLYLDHPDPRSQLFLRTVSDQSGGFYNVGAVVTDTADFLAHFAERMPGYPVHPQRHPPGLPLLFAAARQFFDAHPHLAEIISDGLRPYQCHNLPLMNLPNSAIAVAVIQMVVPAALGLVVWPLYRFGSQIYDEKTAVRAALLWPLLPSVGLWATRWNHLYALFTLAAFIFLYWGLARRRWLPFVMSGLVVSLASFFSFGNVVLVGFLGIYALVWLAAQAERPSWRWLIIAGLFFGAGVSLVWLYVRWAYQLSLFAIWRTAMGTHFSLGRSYITWLGYHLYDFFIFLGIPLFVFWLARTVTAVSEWKRRRFDVLAVSFALALLLLDVSGTSQGETARVWAFLLPLAVLAAVRQISSRAAVFTAVAGLLAAQTLVGNLFLSPVSTGLLDAPAPPPVAVPVSDVPVAVWEDGPILQRVTVPDTITVGQLISIQVIWNNDEQSDKAYTIFIHLLDEQGNLAAQYDGMALNGDWTTTCWQEKRPFADAYQLATPDDLLPGTYQLQMGFYWWPTLERLPLASPPGQSDHNIDIGFIQLH